jgi:hypothetical protein
MKGLKVGLASAPGSSTPVDRNGSYAATWGEFDFGSAINFGRSDCVASSIAAEKAGFEVHSMRINAVHKIFAR